ncbi:hypothetical protein AB4114_22240 [Paenibacillus sp. 2RAB27]|uniref:hypothetical protein n=1 Tax=Paenibacillus sp. 2RAB27 TaxID=3232991 RepID=UPI003F9D9B88
MENYTQSEKLAIDMLSAIGVGGASIATLWNGPLFKTEASSQQHYFVDLDFDDQDVVDVLFQQGMLVYYVLPYVSTLDGSETTSFLVVPKDIGQAIIGNDTSFTPRQRAKAVRDYYKYQCRLAGEGILYAYVVNHTRDFSEYGTIAVRSKGDGLIRVG